LLPFGLPPQLNHLASYAKQALRDKLIEHKAYIRKHGENMPEVKNWRWSPGDSGLGLYRPGYSEPIDIGVELSPRDLS
jgi:hypothetical protein